MLTAQKENIPLDTESVTQRPPSPRSFDKVVNSIEGLRERVQGFTLEQVSDMDQQLHTLLMQLEELQQTLKALTEMKQRINQLSTAVQKAEAESLEQSKLVTLVEPIPVQSITRIGSLLKFHRVIKLLKEANGGSEVLVSAEAQAKSSSPLRPVEVTPNSKNESELETDLSTINHELSDSSDPSVSAGEVPDKFEPVLRRQRAQIDFRPVPPKPDETDSKNSANGATDLLTMGHEPPQKSENETPVDVTSEELELTEANLLLAPEMEFEPLSNEPGDSLQDEPTTSIETQEIAPEFADTRQELLSTRAIEEVNTETVPDRAPMEVSADAYFDQRLLEDLIKDYGEFTILPSSTPTAETKRERKSETTVAEPPINVSVPPVASTQPNLLLPRKDGDLDLKLKKLIKDYGQYDLYSRQTPLKLKTGVVVSFLVLTLIFSGFYFFSSPKPTVPAKPPSASQRQISSEPAPKETAPNAEPDLSETLPISSGSNVDLPKPVDKGTSQNLVNKGTTKRNTK